jgi:predicted alpha/beta superfamily hydrolase
VRPAVVVADRHHASSRADQYVPVRTRLGDHEFGGGGDVYLDLLEHEVLPAVRAACTDVPLVETARAGRVLCGTSIGGVSALYGALTRPQVFGGALALSPSAWVDDGFLLRLVQQRGARAARASPPTSATGNGRRSASTATDCSTALRARAPAGACSPRKSTACTTRTAGGAPAAPAAARVGARLRSPKAVRTPRETRNTVPGTVFRVSRTR